MDEITTFDLFRLMIFNIKQEGSALIEYAVSRKM